MHTIAKIAAELFLLFLHNSEVQKAVLLSCEMYRALVDAGREHNLHTVEDGSEEYHTLVNTLEHLFCVD